MPDRLDLVGRRFGRLVVVEFSHISRCHKSCWLCRCDCGTTKTVTAPCLQNGYTRSCGCLRKEMAAKLRDKFSPTPRRTHGRSGSPEHRCWKSMNRRGLGKCDRELYWDRGIRVCSGWSRSFESFYACMGDRPTPQHSIDRIDTNGNYSCGKCEECVANEWPANCRWATPLEQRINQRPRELVTFRGDSKTITAWAEQLGISQSAMSDRLKKWTLADALTRPRKRQRNSRRVPRV